MAVRLQLRRGTAAQWTSANPLLMQGEMGIETDTLKVKIGDGVTNWTTLPYFTQGATGATGPAGPTGATGPAGPTGPTGPAGTNGTNGTNGVDGVGVPAGGTAGQILTKNSATNYDTGWIDNISSVQHIQQYVKNTTGSTLLKGQAVYINGAQGANPTIALAQANTEATSSKTIGLLEQDLANNAFGYVITEGLLTGLDTSAAIDGDPVWLSPSTAGGFLYGISNKPYAPSHLVFIGYVLRANNSNGVIYCKPQNGFELDEIHNVDNKTVALANGDLLQYESASGLWKNKPQSTLTVAQSQVTNLSTDLATKAALTASQTFTGTQTLIPAAAANIPFILQGATSQTGDYFQVKTAGGTIAAKMTSSTQPRFNLGTTDLSATLGVNAHAAAGVVAVIRGAASQTANLTEWQNVSGTNLSYIEPDGALGFSAGGVAKIRWGSTTILESVGGTASVRINPWAASYVGLIVKGAASQSANLQEWQTSAGVANSWINSAGSFLVTGGSYIESNGRTFLNSSNAAYIPLTVRGTTAQTANLTEWQDSAAGVLGLFTSTGRMTAVALSTTNNYLYNSEESTGGFVRFNRTTAALANPGANQSKVYFRDGTTTGTLKLVFKAGTAGVETAIIDNIDTTGTDTSLLAVKYVSGGTP
jgi:hypothetical protein